MITLDNKTPDTVFIDNTEVQYITINNEIVWSKDSNAIPLNFYMPNGGTITLTKNGSPTEVTLEYTLDGGQTWTTWVENGTTRTLSLSAGQMVYIRNTSTSSTGFSTGTSNYYNFAFSDNVDAKGNVNSLVCKNPDDAACSSHIYEGLFRDNPTLQTADVELPFMSVLNNSYHNMFRNCTALVYPPALPATTITVSSYFTMFYGCSSLVETPVLPAEKLFDYSYYNMFNGCSSLKKVTLHATDITTLQCLTYWLGGVSATGDFYCPNSLDIPTSSSSGIPSGWTRHSIDEDYPYEPVVDALNFTMPNGGDITLTKNGSPTEVSLEYTKDEGLTWSRWTESSSVRSLTLAASEKVYIRNTSDTSTGFSTYGNSYRFSFSDETYADGNCNSLLCKKPENAILTQACYSSLFRGEPNLKTSPQLPSVNLASYCYMGMFADGTGITESPILPAETLVERCYNTLFYNNTNVKKITTYMTDISASNCLSNWVLQTSSTGNFYCPQSLTVPTGYNGIPSGWTRHDI